MNLKNYETGKYLREATVDEAIRSMTAGAEGVIEVDGQPYYYDGPREVWAVVSLGGPAWAVGLTYDHANEIFEATRAEMGIADNADLTGFRCLRITPESAARVLDGYPDGWLMETEEGV